MSKVRLLNICFLWFLVAVSPTSLYASDQSNTWEARLRREVPSAWAGLDSNFGSIEVAGVLVENLNDLTPQKIRYVRKGDRLLLETTQGNSQPGQASCLVGKRGFRLDRQQPDGPYALVFTGTDDKSSVRDRISKKISDSWLQMMVDQGRRRGWVEDVYTNPLCHVLGVEPVFQDGKTLVRVKVMFSAPPGTSRNSLDEGITETLLDPSHHWVVLNSTTRRPNQQDFTWTFEYGDDENGRPTLKKYQMHSKFVDGKGNLGEGWQKWEFSKFSYKPVPDSAFTLAAFGLPGFDSPLGKVTQVSWNYWLLGLALVFAALAMATRIRRSWRPFASAVR